MSLILFAIYSLIGWKFGNWKNFNRLYPTLLFLIIGDLLSQFLLFNHSMWTFHPVGKLDKWFKLNHTLIALGNMVINYPVTVALFLGRMPSSKIQQILYIILWSGIFAVAEWITNNLGILTYSNGWNFWWDCAFNLIIFSMLMLHYKKPLLAWLFVVPLVLGLWGIFKIPFSVMK